MGITPIMDAPLIPDQLVTNVTPAAQTPKEGADFRSVWNDHAGAKASKTAAADVAERFSGKTGNDRADQVQTSDRVKKSDNAPKAEEDTGKASKTDVTGKESPEKAADQPDDGGRMLKDEEIVSATEALSAIVSELGDKIAELLNISPEEFQDLLEAGGITENALLDKDVMSSFLVNALGAGSKLDLLTDEAGYEIYKAGMEMLSEVLTSDSQVGEMTVSELVDAVNSAVSEEIDAISAEIPIVRTEDQDDRSVDRFVRNQDGDFELVTVTENGSVTGQSKVVMQAGEASGDGKGTEGEASGDEHAGAHAQLSLSDIQTENIDAPAPEAPVSYTDNTREIADQILENMKTVTDGDYSDVEMQLHPASLGTLHIHVTNNAGVITASFVTENEAVRAAVESQMVRLAEQFEAQGIKVEAVEVTVASHGFEGNLDRGAGQAADESRSGRGGRRTRRIDLSGDDDELDTSGMDDEKRIAAEMMAANGNKVDYTA